MVLDKPRSRGAMTWGVLAMLLAIPYFAIAGIITILVRHGAPRWFNLLVMLCVWNAFKLLWSAGISEIGGFFVP